MKDDNTRIAVSELVTMFDHVLEEHGFGSDHWHSISWNLHNVEPEQWAQHPQGGGRTIRELVVHLGLGFLMYDSHAFGDGSRIWGDAEIDGVLRETRRRTSNNGYGWHPSTCGKHRAVH